MHKQYITPIKQGSVSDVKIGSHIVFEETDEQGNLHQCTGLDYIIQTWNITVVDNHDRVLEFREQDLPVIHIDQHTDLRPVGPDGINVGNFLRHALDTGFISSAIQINTEYKLLNFDHKKELNTTYILDIDLDFWAPEMSIEYYHKTIQKTKSLISDAKIITIATSPYFLNQELALTILKDLV